MGLWILSFCIIAIEAWGGVYYFDIFMERKRMGWLDKCRHIVLYLACGVVVFLGANHYSMGIKVLLIVLVYMAFCAIFYQADWKQCIFFSVLNYSLLFLVDIFSLLIENILNSRDKLYALEHDLLYIPMKMSWILLLFVLRKIWKGKNSYRKLSHKEWRKFGMMPLFTLASMLLMYFCYSGEKRCRQSTFSLRRG